MYALCNSVLLTGYQRLTDTAVVVAEGKVVALLPQTELPAELPRQDMQGHILCPGFIDLQLNGCGGVMFNDTPDVATLTHMQRTNLRSGTTSFLPTLISDSDQTIEQALTATQAFMQQHQYQVLGMHLEGPYTNPKRRGIHPKEQLRQPSEAMIHYLCSQSPWLKKITLAPELNQAEHIRQLADAGITVSIGHSAATYEQAMAGFDAGIRFATHLYNAMTATENGRIPGIVGAIYDRQDVYTGLVADGFHVHWANVRLAKKVMGERLCLVTDATAAAMPPAGFDKFDFCGAEIFLRNGRCEDANGTLGGSALTMIEGIQLLVEHAGISLDEAVRMATLYPARAIGVDDKLGAIQPGLIANLARFDKNYQIVDTMVGGHWTKDVI
ncbi:N-acetylglucosamine-6-phosphate deacetylase [Tolumonas lignilytica]|uniref:N-acetylglucosamine-6-phosphate deacetylase n=1 Tax=Tolumonas lignilytica TaxID=1283284 RepID=UPI000465DDF1|nr:N-acetylglucosamine-6-phosphate deacetylase [Tolumonas lignilytica]